MKVDDLSLSNCSRQLTLAYVASSIVVFLRRLFFVSVGRQVCLQRQAIFLTFTREAFWQQSKYFVGSMFLLRLSFVVSERSRTSLSKRLGVVLCCIISSTLSLILVGCLSLTKRTDYSSRRVKIFSRPQLRRVVGGVARVCSAFFVCEESRSSFAACS